MVRDLNVCMYALMCDGYVLKVTAVLEILDLFCHHKENMSTNKIK